MPARLYRMVSPPTIDPALIVQYVEGDNLLLINNVEYSVLSDFDQRRILNYRRDVTVAEWDHCDLR